MHVEILAKVRVYTDTAVLFGIRRGFADPVAIIETLWQFCKEHHHQLVIKLHPKEAKSGIWDIFKDVTLNRLRNSPNGTQLLKDLDVLIDGESLSPEAYSSSMQEHIVTCSELVSANWF
eukprot:1186107-Prorocentrum_minimum.AAC.3